MAVFVLIIRVLSIPLGGIQPEALVLIAMMTAPFTLGVAYWRLWLLRGRRRWCSGSGRCGPEVLRLPVAAGSTWRAASGHCSNVIGWWCPSGRGFPLHGPLSGPASAGGAGHVWSCGPLAGPGVHSPAELQGGLSGLRSWSHWRECWRWRPFRLVTRCYSGVTPWTVSIVFRGDRRLPTRQ